MLRRSASMRLITRRGAANAGFSSRTAPACCAFRCAEQRLLVAVPEGSWVEVGNLALHDLRGEREHVGRERQLLLFELERCRARVMKRIIAATTLATAAWTTPVIAKDDQLMPGCIAGESRDGEVRALCRLLYF